VTKVEEIEMQIKTTQFWLDYFCCADISGRARKHMERMINEWKKQLDVSRES